MNRTPPLPQQPQQEKKGSFSFHSHFFYPKLPPLPAILPLPQAIEQNLPTPTPTTTRPRRRSQYEWAKVIRAAPTTKMMDDNSVTGLRPTRSERAPASRPPIIAPSVVPVRKRMVKGRKGRREGLLLMLVSNCFLFDQGYVCIVGTTTTKRSCFGLFLLCDMNK